MKHVPPGMVGNRRNCWSPTRRKVERARRADRIGIAVDKDDEPRHAAFDE